MKKINLLEDRDFAELFKKLWKEKFFILIITTIFSLLFYFYSTSFIKKKLRVEILLQHTPDHLFLDYEKVYSTYYKGSIYENFILDFKLKLLSKINLEKFLKQSKDFQISDFLKKNNIENYSKNFIFIIDNEKKYSLIFPEGVNGHGLLAAYIEYTFIETINATKKKIKKDFKIINSSLNYSLKFAQEFQLTTPYSSELEISYNEKILINRIKIINNLIEDIDKRNFNYDNTFISEAKYFAVPSTINSYRFLQILLAFFLAILIVIFKDEIKRK
jgi:LPS O-antigen subunit length determinant protein (WzzB/FepE family)